MGHEPPYPSATFSGPAEILTENIGAPTAAIVQRMTGAAEPPEAMSDEALAEVGRVDPRDHHRASRRRELHRKLRGGVSTAGQQAEPHASPRAGGG